jgi:hypothetical protein
MAISDVSVILNTIRATSSSAYQTAVPLATAENIVDVGKAVLGLPTTLQNEFIYAANKIGLTLIETTTYENPFMFLKKGKLEHGSTIEDLFIEMAKPHEYIAGTREGDEVPDQYEIFKLINQAGFYSTQLERQYAMTVHDNDMRRAFLSASGVGRFLSAMYESVRSGENRDDYIMTVALMARQIEKALTESPAVWKGEVKLITLYNATLPLDESEPPVRIGAVTAETALQDKGFLQFMANQFKKWSNRLRFIRKDLNFAGVETHIPVENQRIMMLADIQADLDTNLFAWAYNEDRLQIGGFDQIDAWYSIGRNGATTPASLPESISVKSIVKQGESKVLGVIYDPEMVKIYNKHRTTDVSRNARGHYFNTFTTVADIYACSPFKNFVVFTLE